LDNKIVLIIIAVLLPPLAVFLKNGAGKDLFINIIMFTVLYPGNYSCYMAGHQVKYVRFI
jgi:uncharacterized membrane protein YqaE (UPF0057 family)